MRYLKFLLALVFTAAITWLLNTPNPLGTSSIPALGDLLNPFTGFWANADEVPSKEDVTYKLPELSAPVRVVFDQRMVPHIFANSPEDAHFMQGYLTARFRLWQLDITVRGTAGRLSEILGPDLLERDKMQRRRGMLAGARNAVEVWKQTPEKLGLLQAYVDGINAYIDQLSPKDYPLEYKLLGYKPEPWSMLHTAIVMKAMANTLCSKEYDIENTNTLQWLGEDAFHALFPEYNPRQTPIVPSGTQWDFEPVMSKIEPAQESSLGYLPAAPYEKPSPFLGSNNWVVSGQKTASGNPILCNDPHLNLTLPSIWIEMQLHTPDYNVYGVHLPGLPGIMLGFNEHIAWGFTNGSQDVLDWYKLEWQDPQQTTYLFDGEKREVELRVEAFKVKGKGIERDTIKWSHLGPVVYEDPENDHYGMAMHWVAIQPPKEFGLAAIFKLNAAKNYEEYLEALKLHVSPIQNAVFASKDGDIALHLIGDLPLKQAEQGRFVQNASTTANLWQGFVPEAQEPSVKNPESGFILSANQHTTDSLYPYYYSGTFDDYRARYIHRLLSGMEQITMEDMMEMQTSNFSLLAADALPDLLEQLGKNKLNTIQEGLVEILETWDYRFDAGEKAPVLFDAWWDSFMETTWDEFFAVRDTLDILIPESWRTIDMLQHDPLNVYWDIQTTPERESLSDIALISFQRMIKNMQQQLDEVDYDWGQHTGFQIPHLARIPAFASQRLEPGGYSQAINAVKYQNGPSWRMIVEMDTIPKGYGVFPGGQSGNPGSHFYDNTVETWEDGKYFELFFMKSPQDRTMEVYFTENYQ